MHVTRFVRQVHLSNLESIPGKKLIPMGPLYITKSEKLGIYQLFFRDVAKFVGIGPSEESLERMTNEACQEARVSAERIGATHILNVKFQQDVTRFKFSRNFLITFEGMMHKEVLQEKIQE